MKLIAHRGWAEGRGENTLSAFAQAASDPRIAGVELDVCRAPDTGALVVSHDPPACGATVLPLDAALTFLASTDLELLVEIKQEGIAPAVIDALAAHKIAARATVFAFADVAGSLPWASPRRVRLGIIVLYPWQLDRAARTFAPDGLLLGWDARAWTRLAFRAWWSVFSLQRLSQRHRVPVVVGIVQRRRDLDWLARQHVYAAVADIEPVFGDHRA